jgi:hypothetical protein
VLAPLLVQALSNAVAVLDMQELTEGRQHRRPPGASIAIGLLRIFEPNFSADVALAVVAFFS